MLVDAPATNGLCSHVWVVPALAAILCGLVVLAEAANAEERVPSIVCKPAIEQADRSARLRIRASGFPSNHGVARFAIYRGATNFTRDGGWVCKGTSRINAANLTELVFALPPGNYAVGVAHDENNNDEIDRRLVPLEAYGFSNYELMPFGRPQYEKASFDLEAGDHSIEVPLSFHPAVRSVAPEDQN